MKKIISIILIICMLLSASAISFGASEFADITDEVTAGAVEVLRLMGVVDGMGDGNYHPEGTLTRAEFAKLAVVSTHSDADLAKYKNMTIFPDVKASQWFAPYINMAAKNLQIILGYTDGLFHPEGTISSGEAITIILRLIGFSDSEVGGVWPYGHFDFAKSIGLLAGTEITSATQNISRGDAAKLFVNSISVDAHQKNQVFHISPETVLISVNAASKTLKTKDNTYSMQKSMTTTGLLGKAGYVVMDSRGNALSFLPKSVLSYDYPTAVVLKSVDAAVLNSLAGRTDYTIYKNGAKVTLDKLRVGDVAVYVASENKIIVTDTKLAVYYESCEGSPAEPISIKALGRTFSVLPSAVSTISKYKPGVHITISLSPDGKVAAASGSSNGNAVFIVSLDGTADLIVGNDIFDYNLPVSDTKLYGKAVDLDYADANKLSFSALSASATLNISSKKLGSKKISDNALVFLNGESATLADLLDASVSYYRSNANGEVDLIVASDSSLGKLVAGKVGITKQTAYDHDGQPYEESRMLFTGPNGISVETIAYAEDTSGYYIGSYNGTKISSTKKLSNLGTVKQDAFDSSQLVTVNGSAKTIYKNVSCYNKDVVASTQNPWSTLEEAFAYGKSFTLYGLNGIVYLIEFKY